MPYILSVDPGMSTGLALGYYDATTPLNVRYRMQITGGVEGLYELLKPDDVPSLFDAVSEVVCEKFTPRPHAGGGGLTRKTVEPLRVEGLLIALFGPGMVTFREPAGQYFSGGSTHPERKKRSREFLKDHGLYLTGRDVGQPDADDAISATLHLIGYMVDKGHRPTLEHYFKEG